MANGETLYKLDTVSHTLLVFGEPDMGWYEWELVSDGIPVAGGGGYGAVHVALREGLNAAELLEG